MAYLEIKNLSKKYGEKEGIQNLSVNLEKGKILTVLGASGSGKTTLLRCLVGLSSPDQGTVTLEGKNLIQVSQEDNIFSRIGLVFQSFHLFPHLTVLENVALAPLLASQKKIIFKQKTVLNDDRARTEAERLLEWVDMSAKKDAYPCELSGGQQQRVAIARALALNPEILAFDEPTSALDPALRGEVTRLFKDLKSRGKTLIVVTHDLDFARSVSDDVLLLKDGKIESQGPASEMFQTSSPIAFEKNLVE